jgi:hypothetical protein
MGLLETQNKKKKTKYRVTAVMQEVIVIKAVHSAHAWE